MFMRGTDVHAAGEGYAFGDILEIEAAGNSGSGSGDEQVTVVSTTLVLSDDVKLAGSGYSVAEQLTVRDKTGWEEPPIIEVTAVNDAGRVTGLETRSGGVYKGELGGAAADMIFDPVENRVGSYDLAVEGSYLDASLEPPVEIAQDPATKLVRDPSTGNLILPPAEASKVYSRAVFEASANSSAVLEASATGAGSYAAGADGDDDLQLSLASKAAGVDGDDDLILGIAGSKAAGADGDDDFIMGIVTPHANDSSAALEATEGSYGATAQLNVVSQRQQQHTSPALTAAATCGFAVVVLPAVAALVSWRRRFTKSAAQQVAEVGCTPTATFHSTSL
jgi:hypothetical protein